MALNSDVGSSVKVAVAISVFALIASVLMPVALTTYNSDNVVQATQSAGNTSTLAGGLNTTVTNVDTTADDVTVELDYEGETTSATIANGSNSTLTINSEDITVTVDDIVDSQTATLTYEIPRTFGWPGSAKILFGAVPIMLLLTVVLFTVGYAISTFRKYK